MLIFYFINWLNKRYPIIYKLTYKIKYTKDFDNSNAQKYIHIYLSLYIIIYKKAFLSQTYRYNNKKN